MMTNVAIVTGGSKGIGKAIVERLAREAYIVYNLDITPSEGHYRYCDVSNVEQVKAVIADIAQETGRIDALISNAGRHLSATIEDTDEATFDALFALNVKGAYAAIQAVLPSMKAKRQGSIVLIASDQALIGQPNSFAPLAPTSPTTKSIQKTDGYSIKLFLIANQRSKRSVSFKLSRASN